MLDGEGEMGGGDEKRSSPHSHRVRKAGRMSREEVCVCERERERRSTRGQAGIYVQGRDLFGLAYYCNWEWSWDCDN